MILFCLLAFIVLVRSDQYVIGRQGESCYLTCYKLGQECGGSIPTNNSTQIFSQLGISCKPNPLPWWSNDQPAYISDSSDPNYGECLGYTNVPDQVWCGGNYKASRRLCNCVPASEDDEYFGTGYSGGVVNGVEQDIFTHFLTPGHTGVMTHFWTTALEKVMGLTMVRYYIDGEETASIQFIPSVAAGVGFEDPQAPWGNRWIGKGAKDGAWYFNFRIPFQKSIRITVQSTDGKAYGGFYIIVRGARDLPTDIAGIKIPATARLVQQIFHKNVSALDYVAVADIPSGPGLFFMHTLVVKSGTPNFLEGCYHAYSPYNQKFPGTLISTGTEDYFDSAWYFNGGEFHLDNAGFTHWKQASSSVLEFSAYRFHETDPLKFSKGFKFVWRNGDALNPKTGLKCFQEQGGTIVGTPTVSEVLIYAWTYTW